MIWFFLLLIALGPFNDPEICLAKKNLAPSWSYWFGTDDLGRDLFCRVCWGLRISLALAACVTLFETILGILWGSLAAYRWNWMIRFCDVLGALPSLLIVILLTAFLGAGFTTLFVGITLVGWVNPARIVYGTLLDQNILNMFWPHR
jgi:ABC-type dipeptide/oligopeptide/nickel transport system permease subunit